MITHTKKPSDIPALTGVRFAAALLVLTGHSVHIMRFPGPPPYWHVLLSQLTGLGMPLFFVLSGFVIHYNYWDTVYAQRLRGSYNFFVARFARLYPMYFLFFLSIFFSTTILWVGTVRQCHMTLRSRWQAIFLSSRAGTIRSLAIIR